MGKIYHALQWKSHLCIPFLGIARPQSQFPHSFVCEWFIYSQDRSTYVGITIVINCRLFIKSPFYIIWELRLVVPSFQHFYLIYFYSAWIYNTHSYLFLSSAWIRILFHYYIYIYHNLLIIWEHDISECSLWNIPAQSSNPWPLAWLTFLLNFKCALLQRTLGWSHHKVLYSIIIFIIILKS